MPHRADTVRRPTPGVARRWVVSSLAVAACACTGAGDPATGPTDAPPSGAPSPAAASGVGVLAVGCGPSAGAGSGVVLGSPGQVVTVAHTVAGATSIAVVAADGTQFEGRVVAFDPRLDLAVLAVDGLDAPALDAGRVELGDAAVVRWSVDGGVEVRQVEVTERLAVTIDDIYGSRQVQRRGIELAGEIDVGDSGGPVVSAAGDVIGIVYARSRTRSSTAFATDVAEVTALLASVDADDRESVVDNGTCV